MANPDASTAANIALQGFTFLLQPFNPVQLYLRSRALFRRTMVNVRKKAEQPATMPDVAAPALLSFLKQVSVEPSWDAKRLTKVLNIDRATATQVIATLEMLGYIEAVEGKKGHWRNTAAGNTVSGAKTPRLNRDSVVGALDDLKTRAEQMNAAAASPFHVAELIAFGDFLDGHAKVQAADVAVGLTERKGQAVPETAVEHKHEEHVLTELRAKSTMMHLVLLEDWMRKRWHETLLG